MQTERQNYLVNLKDKMHNMVVMSYAVSKAFPKDELYGATSQFRRATLSVPLNFIEGYARKKLAVKLNFWEISYGSLKEAQYLLYFAFTQDWIQKNQFDNLNSKMDEVAAMLWKAMSSLNQEK